jgi:hypothetical protein
MKRHPFSIFATMAVIYALLKHQEVAKGYFYEASI